MNVVTCGDLNFFHFIHNLERNLSGHHDVRLFVYDLGLTESQKASLKSPILQAPFPEDAFDFNRHGNIKTTHKPACLRDFMLAFGEDCLYLDGDTLLVESLDLEEMLKGADLAVTYRHPRERKPHILRNGVINAGVIAFKRSEATLEFLDEWEKACARPNMTDQMALSDLLSAEVDWNAGGVQRCGNIRVSILQGEEYNDVTCRTGKIFHFKSAARRRSKYVLYQLFSAFQRRCPRLVARLVEKNRACRLLVWKQRASSSESPAVRLPTAGEGFPRPPETISSSR